MKYLSKTVFFQYFWHKLPGIDTRNPILSSSVATSPMQISSSPCTKTREAWHRRGSAIAKEISRVNWQKITEKTWKKTMVFICIKLLQNNLERCRNHLRWIASNTAPNGPTWICIWGAQATNSSISSVGTVRPSHQVVFFDQFRWLPRFQRFGSTWFNNQKSLWTRFKTWNVIP